MKKLMMIAGPNGAGKTTTANAFLSQQEDLIPENDIRRRYFRGLKNLINLYLPLADTVLILDNSTAESGVRKIIARKQLDRQLQIEDEKIWETMRESTNVKI